MKRRGEISDSIPNDLVVEIFLRLPSKSIARFRCVSKLWGSMLRSPYFTELFLTRSWARPRLLLALELNRDGEWSLFSSPQHQNPYDGKVTVAFHMKLSKDMCPKSEYFRGLTSGLIYFSSLKIKDKDTALVIFNPTTRQYVSLPKLKRHISFLGFDPSDKQFKALSIVRQYGEKGDHHRILPLETGKMSWRKIQCPFDHKVWSEKEAICINGVLHYLAEKSDGTPLIVCFDFSSENFKFIDAVGYYDDDSYIAELINYKGKLGVLYQNYDALELRLWVLEDVEKQEWSKYVYTLPDNELFNNYNVFFAGVTAAGEFVFATMYTSKFEPSYVFYFNPERKTFQRVGIQGFGDYYYDETNLHRVCAFVDYVEDLHVNDAKYLKPMPKYQ